MAGISLGRAFASGFVLIRRRPASVFVWGLLSVLLIQAPMLVLLYLAAADLMAVWGRIGPENHAAVADFAMAMQQRMTAIRAMTLPAVAVRVIVVAAVYRAVLEPARPGFAYLRIGRREGWLLLLMLTLAILVACAIIPLELLMIVPVIALARAAAPALLVGGGGVLVGLAVLVWVLARLSMAAPMTFAERRFRLFESWRLTRGHGLALIALGLLVFLFAALVEVAIFALAAAVAVGFVGWPMNFRTVLVGLNSLRLQGPEALAVWLVPIGLVAAAAFGALYAIVVAPWADVYAQLNGRPDSRA